MSLSSKGSIGGVYMFTGRYTFFRPSMLSNFEEEVSNRRPPGAMEAAWGTRKAGVSPD